MTDNQLLPLLEILPVGKLVLHEYHDAQRSQPLAAAIRKSGLIRNPPIVVPLDEGDGRYLVLDGANRVTSIQRLDIAHIVAQVVDADHPGLNLSSWNHVIWGMSPDELLERFRRIPDIELQPTDGQPVSTILMDIHSIAVFCAPAGVAYGLRTSRLQVREHVDLLNAVVSCYQSDARLDRTKIMDPDPLRTLYPDLSGLMILPSLRVDQLIYVASNGQLMPPGSTRFTISPRVLHLNYPLDRLAADKSLDEKNADLQQFVQERLSKKRVRYYEEATFLFDE